MDFMLSRATRVTAQWASAPEEHAVARFWRDMEMTLSNTGFVPDNRLMICLAPAPPPAPQNYTRNYIEGLSHIEYASIYNTVKISRRFRRYIEQLGLTY